MGIYRFKVYDDGDEGEKNEKKITNRLVKRCYILIYIFCLKHS